MTAIQRGSRTHPIQPNLPPPNATTTVCVNPRLWTPSRIFRMQQPVQDTTTTRRESPMTVPDHRMKSRPDPLNLVARTNVTSGRGTTEVRHRGIRHPWNERRANNPPVTSLTVNDDLDPCAGGNH